jgi:glycosyltransferase involved in cell wall biosynthesis
MRRLPGDKLKILYVGDSNPNANGYHRQLAMKRLGHEVCTFDTTPYNTSGMRITRSVRYRTVMGPTVDRLNRDVPVAAASFAPDLVWFDKAKYTRRETVAKLRAAGIYTIHQNDDNPFQPESEGGSRNILGALPEYDLHLLPRRVSLEDYRKAGARDVYWFVPAYEPSLHYPPPPGWSDADRTIDVSFIGHPYDKRPGYVLDLWKRHGIKTLVWGDTHWARKWPLAKLPPDARKTLYQGSFLPTDRYRETLWRSRIALGFVNNTNKDEFSGRSFEIPACGTFLLVEDTKGHRDMYKDGEEVVLFNSIEDCAQKIKRYLGDEDARARIARAGHARAVASGYSTDERIRGALAYARSKTAQGD